MQKPSEFKPWMQFWGTNLPDPEDINCSVYTYLYKRNQNDSNNIALNYFDRKITYEELFNNIKKTAKAYQKLGVKSGDIVTICSVMTPETIYSFYALDMLGATLNMADPRTSSHGLHEYIEEVKSKVVCTLDLAYEKVKKAIKDTAVKHVIAISPSDSLSLFKKVAYKLSNRGNTKYDDNVIFWNDFIEKGEGIPDIKPEEYDPEHAILIVHTGGTTGSPKGVMLSDKAVNALAMQMGLNRYKRKERFLNIMPPFIAYGFCCGVHTPLTAGGEVIVIPNFEPKDFGTLLNKYHPEHTAGVPLHYQNLVTDPAMKKADLSYIISTGSGGDGITRQAEESVNEFLKSHNSKYLLCKGYGMTEVSAGATACIKDINKCGSVGIPLFLTTIGIFKPGSDEELDFGCEGEICISTPTMMMGYYNMPDETEKVIRKHSDGKLWVHTGDIGMMDKDGYVFIINRIKRMIIRHDGFKVFPSAIEDVICTIPGVELACAVAISDNSKKQGDLPFVFVKPSSDFLGDINELEKSIRNICSIELPEYVQPVGYNFIDKFPYTSIGKVDYLSLQERAKSIS